MGGIPGPYPGPGPRQKYSFPLLGKNVELEPYLNAIAVFLSRGRAKRVEQCPLFCRPALPGDPVAGGGRVPQSEAAGGQRSLADHGCGSKDSRSTPGCFCNTRGLGLRRGATIAHFFAARRRLRPHLVWPAKEPRFHCPMAFCLTNCAPMSAIFWKISGPPPPIYYWQDDNGDGRFQDQEKGRSFRADRRRQPFPAPGPAAAVAGAHPAAANHPPLEPFQPACQGAL